MKYSILLALVILKELVEHRVLWSTLRENQAKMMHSNFQPINFYQQLKRSDMRILFFLYFVWSVTLGHAQSSSPKLFGDIYTYIEFVVLKPKAYPIVFAAASKKIQSVLICLILILLLRVSIPHVSRCPYLIQHGFMDMNLFLEKQRKSTIVSLYSLVILIINLKR